MNRFFQNQTFLLLLGVFLASCGRNLIEKPLAKDGLWALGDWDLEKQGTVELTGDWRVIRNTRVKAGPLSQLMQDHRQTSWAPETWKSDANNFGFTTYLLHLDLGDPHEQALKVALSFGETMVAARLEVWDETGSHLIASLDQGVPSMDPRLEVPVMLTTSCQWPATARHYLVKLETSNHVFKFGGLKFAPRLGMAVAIQTSENRDLILRSMNIGACLIIGIFNWFLSWQRRGDMGSLAFGFVCFWMALREIVTARFFELSGIGVSATGFDILQRLTYITLPSIVIAAAIFFRGFNLVTGLPLRLLELWTIGLGGFLILLSTFAELLTFTRLLWLYQLHLGAACLAGMTMLAFRAWQGNKPARQLGIALFFLVLGVTNDILYHRGLIESIWMSTYAFVVFILTQSAFISAHSAEQGRRAKHSYRQLAKVFYPHQIKIMEAGGQLEDSMPLGRADACVICFDVANSSKIQLEGLPSFFESIFAECGKIMMHGYQQSPPMARAFRVKEMGDGFLCTVGFPFQSPQENIFAESVELAQCFLQAFQSKVAEVSGVGPLHCGIGISYGPVEAVYPKSSPIEYDLFGRGIVLATRYEKMRKLIFASGVVEGDIIVLQESVYQALPLHLQGTFQKLTLHDQMVVRDDLEARHLYYKVDANQISGQVSGW